MQGVLDAAGQELAFQVLRRWEEIFYSFVMSQHESPCPVPSCHFVNFDSPANLGA